MAFYAVWIAVRGHRGRADFSTFKYFTTDSNAFAGAVSLLAAAYTLPVLLAKKECVPKPVLMLKYVGTCSVALTFFVALLFLGVIFGHGTMYDGIGFYMHGIVPVLTMISWIALDRGRIFGNGLSFLDSSRLYCTASCMLYRFLCAVWRMADGWISMPLTSAEDGS